MAQTYSEIILGLEAKIKVLEAKLEAASAANIERDGQSLTLAKMVTDTEEFEEAVRDIVKNEIEERELNDARRRAY